MNRFIFALLCVMLSGAANAQISSIRVQASGLTCAMCARSIYKNLEGLPFIAKLDTDLEASAFLLVLKPNIPVDPDLIRKKVEDAGFGVASLSLISRIEGPAPVPGRHLTLSGMHLHILDVKGHASKAGYSMRLVDKAFLGPKDQKRYARAGQSDCFIYGKASGDCCTSAGIPTGARIYHVVI